MVKVFDKTASTWRGIGKVPGSGLRIRKGFSSFDAETRFHPKAPPAREPKGCLCGDVLKGVKTPADCGLFGKACTPAHPAGACMVSGEGTCAAYFKYGAKHG
jgi:hydrogenase expression/formation protein HypD